MTTILLTSHVTTYIPISQQYRMWAGSASEQTPSESAATSDEEVLLTGSKQPSQPTLPRTRSAGYDYVEPVGSGSSVSSPASSEDEPFASDKLGETVIKLDKVGEGSWTMNIIRQVIRTHTETTT